MAFPPMFTISFALFSMNFTGWPVKGEATTEPTIVTALPGTTTSSVAALAAPFPVAAPTALTSSPKVTPGGTGRDWEDPPIRIGPTATETSPFVRCTSCMPAGTDTERAPCSVTDPPGIVTEPLPLDTVIIPGELDVTVIPLPFSMADVVTPFDRVTVVAPGDGPLVPVPPPACEGGAGDLLPPVMPPVCTLPTGSLGLIAQPGVGTMIFSQSFFFFAYLSFFFSILL